MNRLLKGLLLVATLIPAGLAGGAARAEEIQTTAQTIYIVDFQTGAVMMDKNSTARIEPASLTKMMTAYLAFEALKAGKIKLTDTLPVSQRA